MRIILSSITVLLIGVSVCRGQQFDTVNVTNIPIQLDSFVVKSGFDPTAFIKRVRQDTTFYKAFRSLHLVPFSSVNCFTAYDDEEYKEVALMSNRTIQHIDNGCRTTQVLEEQSAGDFYKKNGDLNYYTAELFNNLFFSKEPVCNETDIVAGALEKHGSGRMEKNKYELKQLIFNPGSKVSGVPFMGDKASIFDESETSKYNFKIRQEVYEGQDCIVFCITPKPEYSSKVVYNELNTWFRRSDYSIVARDYSLSFKTMFYDFNVKMKVRTTIVKNKLYPVTIDYDGTWHVMTKKREHMIVKMEIKYF